MKRVLAVLGASIFVMACDQNPTQPVAPAPPSLEISDAAHGGAVDGFYFLPPTVPEPVTTGTFNPYVAPRVVICELDETVDPASCGFTVADYTLTGGTDGAMITMSETDELYQVQWNTRNFDLNHALTYRISVYLTVYDGALELGHADVQLGSNKGELKNVDTNETIPLVDNQTLPLKFRVETGAGCDGALDCGSGQVGATGGIVTTANGTAGVSVPAGAVDNPITITIRQLDPAQLPGGVCLPTGIRQDGACYDFDTVEEISTVQNDESDTFHQDVTVAICPSPTVLREERLTLHKYNPERQAEGVVELANASAGFLECDQTTGPGYIAAAPSLLGRLAGAARRVFAPVASALLPGDLHARDIGLAGLTDSFSRITWAESITLSASAATSASPGATVPVPVSALTAHNHDVAPTGGTDARLRFDYTDPDGVPSFWYVTIDAQGQATGAWELTEVPGVHTLVVSSRSTDPTIVGDPLIEDPTVAQTVQLVVCEPGLDCGLATVDNSGGLVTTADGSAGVIVPQGAVLEPVTIVVQQLDPAAQTGGRCLPTGIRQDGACYQFDTVEEISDVTGGSPTFLQDVTVAFCQSPNAVRPDHLTLHKYDPGRASEGVVELQGAQETFLDCSSLSGPGYAAAPAATFLGRVAQATSRALRPVAAALAPQALYARDIGLAGLTDSFSRMSWAEPLTFTESGIVSNAAPGQLVTGTISATTAHNHVPDHPATAATDATLRFEYTDPAGAITVWHESTGAQGAAPLSLTLTQVPGIHTVVVTTRDTDPSLQGTPLIADPTAALTLTVNATAGSTVNGFVQYAGGGLGGVTVELVPGTSALGTPSHTGVTDGNGQVVFQSVADGTYYFKAYGPTSEYIGWKASVVTVAGGLTHTLQLPKNIILLSPTSGATVSTTKPALTWTANPDAASYTVQVNATSPWALVEQNTGVLVNIDTVNTPLTSGETYTWQVDAQDANGNHVGSTTGAFQFTVASGTNFTLDQENGAIPSATTYSNQGSSLSQSFTPGASPLVAVKLLLRAGGSFTSDYTSIVRIRNGSPTGTVVGTGTQIIPAATTGAHIEATYLLDWPVQVDPGATYVIEWVSPSPTILTWFGETGDPYAGGEAFAGSASNQDVDHIFWTYSP